jgi:ketosteroid isomerase-like protein
MMRFFSAVSAVLLVCTVAAAQNAAPVSSPAKSPAASTDSAEIQQFQTIENKWSDAENKHDQFGLDLVLSPLLVDVAANGDITTHDQQVVQAITNQDKMYFLSRRVIAVRMLGDIAVVDGTYLLRHRLDSGQVVTDKGVFTHVFQRQRGGWMCVNAQQTQVAQDSNSKKKHKNDKKSTAGSLPFHVPFFGKGNKN